MTDTIAAILGQGGPFARHLTGFAPRPAQQQMAVEVAAAIAEREHLIVEAGTGTGKTLAYLVPALLSGKQVIVSTGTRTLQDQLFHRDLPLVHSALDTAAPVALLKGRSNYLCRYRCRQLYTSGMLTSQQDAHDLQIIRDWSGRTRSGDIAEVDGVAEDSLLWSRVTSTTDNCLGQDCSDFSDCHVQRARRAAQEARLVVVNHHLLFADMVLREEGFAELLPGADVLILDEAHQLADIASEFFGGACSSRQLHDLVRDVDLAVREEAPDMAVLQRSGEHLRLRVQALRDSLGAAGQRRAWQQRQRAVTAALGDLNEALHEFAAHLEEGSVRGKSLEKCFQRCTALQQRLACFEHDSEEGEVNWYETSRRGFVLRNTPLDIAPVFQECMARYPASWIFTSATLAVDSNFDYFRERLGLDAARSARWDSPFDFSRHALAYVPQGLPVPAAHDYNEAVVTAALPVLTSCDGGVFMLFTSHRALQQAAQRIAREVTDRRILVQGSEPRHVLLERFRADGRALLLGTGSFWEGVDVRGSALACVIIDKLPFATPDDPVFQARSAALRRSGGNPFMDYQVPNAVIALKQGAGRLIRDVDDRGVLMLCDPRLYSKSYGRIFLDNLPPMPVVRERRAVEQFLAAAPHAQSAMV